MSRLARTVLLAAVALCIVAPSAGAAAPGHLLGDVWTTVLETPTAENPFGTGDPACLDLGGNTVAPFTPLPPGLHVHREAQYEGLCRSEHMRSAARSLATTSTSEPRNPSSGSAPASTISKLPPRSPWMASQ